jgi:hypothetical protein
MIAELKPGTRVNESHIKSLEDEYLRVANFMCGAGLEVKRTISGIYITPVKIKLDHTHKNLITGNDSNVQLSLAKIINSEAYGYYEYNSVKTAVLWKYHISLITIRADGSYHTILDAYAQNINELCNPNCEGFIANYTEAAGCGVDLEELAANYPSMTLQPCPDDTIVVVWKYPINCKTNIGYTGEGDDIEFIYNFQYVNGIDGTC